MHLHFNVAIYCTTSEVPLVSRVIHGIQTIRIQIILMTHISSPRGARTTAHVYKRCATTCSRWIIEHLSKNLSRKYSGRTPTGSSALCNRHQGSNFFPCWVTDFNNADVSIVSAHNVMGSALVPTWEQWRVCRSSNTRQPTSILFLSCAAHYGVSASVCAFPHPQGSRFKEC